MSRSRSNASNDRPAGPQDAIDALLGGGTGDPGGLLLRRAMWLETLDRQLRLCLPPAVAAHARLANVDRGRLVYLVDAPVWHARLRLAATELLNAARSLGLEATDLVVRIASGPQAMRPADPASPTAVAASPLSAAAREAFATALASRDTPSQADPSRCPPDGPDPV
ncbi:MAG: DciA family protein [Pseudomonadota bacterium]